MVWEGLGPLGGGDRPFIKAENELIEKRRRGKRLRVEWKGVQSPLHRVCMSSGEDIDREVRQ